MVPTSGPSAFDLSRNYEWTDLAEPPLEPRDRPIVVWTGDDVLVWGGTSVRYEETEEESRLGARNFSDGALYNEETGTWRATAEAPAALRERDNIEAVWTGTELAVLAGGASVGDGSSNQSVFTYDPLTDRWRPLDRPPFAPERLLAADGLMATVSVPTRPAEDAYQSYAAEVSVSFLAEGSWQEPVTLSAEAVEPLQVAMSGPRLRAIAATCSPPTISTWTLEVEDEAWEPVDARQARPAEFPGAWLGPDGSVIASEPRNRTGPCGGSGGSFGPPQSPYLWIPNGDQWSRMPLGYAPMAGTSTLWAGGALLAVGGGRLGVPPPTGRVSYAAAAAYDPGTGRWWPVEAAPTGAGEIVWAREGGVRIGWASPLALARMGIESSGDETRWTGATLTPAGEVDQIRFAGWTAATSAQESAGDCESAPIDLRSSTSPGGVLDPSEVDVLQEEGLAGQLLDAGALAVATADQPRWSAHVDDSERFATGGSLIVAVISSEEFCPDEPDGVLYVFERRFTDTALAELIEFGWGTDTAP